MSENYLIVGLGNPGYEYDMTRHNIGFMVIDAWMEKLGVKGKEDSKMKGFIAKAIFDNKTVYLLKPSTFMNLSGEAVRKCLDYYKIPLKNLLVIVDDTNIPFEEFRLKPEGSSGGHNGLKNIEMNLHTNAYNRLRIGIDQPTHQQMSGYVLGKFTSEEKEKLSQIVNQAIDHIEIFIRQDVKDAMTTVNRRLHKESKRLKEDEL